MCVWVCGVDSTLPPKKWCRLKNCHYTVSIIPPSSNIPPLFSCQGNFPVSSILPWKFVRLSNYCCNVSPSRDYEIGMSPWREFSYFHKMYFSHKLVLQKAEMVFIYKICTNFQNCSLIFDSCNASFSYYDY